jgi:hypothetical protein
VFPQANGIIRRLKRLGKVKVSTSYAEAMESAFKNQAERREFINRTFEGRPPSTEHHQLGQLLSSRVFKDALTTNFDHLLEIGAQVFQACDLVDLTTLYGLFSDASRTEAFSHLADTFWADVERRGPAVGLWLSARKALEKSAYLDKLAVVKLLRAISNLHRQVVPAEATSDDWHLLGSMHLTIGKLH